MRRGEEVAGARLFSAKVGAKARRRELAGIRPPRRRVAQPSVRRRVAHLRRRGGAGGRRRGAPPRGRRRPSSAQPRSAKPPGRRASHGAAARVSDGAAAVGGDKGRVRPPPSALLPSPLRAQRSPRSAGTPGGRAGGASAGTSAASSTGAVAAHVQLGCRRVASVAAFAAATIRSTSAGCVEPTTASLRLRKFASTARCVSRRRPRTKSRRQVLREDELRPEQR